MTRRRPLGLPSLKLLGIAAIAGVIAGAAAVYMREAGSGNGTAASLAGDCAAAAESAARLKPLMKGDIAAMSPASPIRKLQPLAFTDANGKPLSLEALSGKTLLVNLWATWCVPCREEMPALNKLQAAKGGDRFEVVAVNIDTGDDTKPKRFLSETGVDHLALYRDASMGVFNALKKEGLAFGLPVTLLVDPKGCLVGAMNGPAAWDGPDAAALIEAAL